MRIGLDAMGGDYAPKETILGALDALELLEDRTKIVLLGDREVILKNLPGELPKKIEIHHTPSFIEMGEHPVKALKTKPDASIPTGIGMLKLGHIDAFCSAGNTGAMHVASMFTIKTIPGIIRPAIASMIPKEDGRYGVIVDVGANADTKADVLEQFAQLGSIFAQGVFDIPKPKVGLINMGEEESKGPPTIQAAHQLLKMDQNIRFIGNIEGRDLFNNKADVIVCDGFTGNVILKMAESFFDLLKERNKLDPFFELFNYEQVGGSPILGINGIVLIGHGVSNRNAISHMVFQAEKMIKSEITQKIKAFFSD
jgi:phosphate acyltransferase